MPSGIDNDSEFFGSVGNEAGGIGVEGTSGVAKDSGAGGKVGRDPLKAEADSGSFGETPPTKKRRGRPPGSGTGPRASAKAKAENSFGSGVDLEPDKVLKSQIDEMAATIRGRQMMVGMLLGLPPEAMPDDGKVRAEALAWIKFQAQFPKVKLSAKAEAIMGLTAASFASYMPLMAVTVAKMQQAKQQARAVKAAPFRFGGGPVNQPGAPPPTANGHDTSAPSPSGEETVILSGVRPDGGTLKFN
jgi:hypothetical protein